MTKWPTAALGEVARIVSGATPKTGISEYWEGDIAWATPKDLSRLQSAHIHRTERRLSVAGLRSCSAELLPPGSILLSSRAPIGLVAINRQPMATNQGFKSLIPNPNYVDVGFLYHWLKSQNTLLQSLGNGATFKELSKTAVARIAIPLPPMEEQRRVAAILDHAHNLGELVARHLKNLDQLQRSTFNAIFGDPASWASRWPMGRIGDTVREARYGTSAKASNDGTVPVLRMGNLTVDGRLELANLKYMDLDQNDWERYTVRRGDILFNRTNSADLVGKTAVVRTDEEFAYAGYLVRVRLKHGFESDFVSGYLNSAHGKKTLRAMCKSIVGQSNINAREMQTIRIALPPHETQKRFARIVAAIDSQRDRLKGQKSTLAPLVATLQARAFADEL